MAGTGKGWNPADPPPPREAPNDDNACNAPTQPDSRYYPAPGYPDYTRYYLTIPTGWHIDATQALRETASQPPADEQTRHIANHAPTRTRELLNMRTPFLHALCSAALQEITDRTASLPLPTDHSPPDEHTDLIDMIEAPVTNPYAGLASTDDDPILLGPLATPPICTLVLNVAPIGLKAPLLAPMNQRAGLPHVYPGSLSIRGLRHLAHTVRVEANTRELPHRGA